MKNFWIKDIGRDMIGREVGIYGWVHRVKTLGKISFIQIRDKTGITQVVASSEDIDEVKIEDVVYVEGNVEISRSRIFPYEIHANRVDILSSREVNQLPFDFRNENSFENTSLAKRLDYRWYDLRNPFNTKIFEILSSTVHYVRDFFYRNQFDEIFSSKIINTFTEGGADLFFIKYFDKEAYLTQSPQFYKQMAVIGGLERVFEIGHVYRAEPHHTKRHLVEFVSIDAEMAFIDSDEDVRRFLEDLLKFVIPKIEREYSDFFENYNIEIMVPNKIPEISMYEVYKLISGSPCDRDLSTKEEKLLSKMIKKEYDSDFVFITQFPWKVRPFYTRRIDHDLNKTFSFDLIFNGEELVTGGQREHRYKKLLQQVVEKGINPERIKWYLEMFRYGAPSHGGFGMGLERLVKNIVHVQDIREVSISPRDPNRLLP